MHVTCQYKSQLIYKHKSVLNEPNIVFKGPTQDVVIFSKTQLHYVKIAIIEKNCWQFTHTKVKQKSLNFYCYVIINNDNIDSIFSSEKRKHFICISWMSQSCFLLFYKLNQSKYCSGTKETMVSYCSVI